MAEQKHVLIELALFRRIIDHDPIKRSLMPFVHHHRLHLSPSEKQSLASPQKWVYLQLGPLVFAAALCLV